MFNMIRHAILVAFLFHSTNAAIHFPASLARKIPECAQECVLSFLNVNYNSVDHASLETLCSKNGASGFTLGEGAVQCVTAERRVQYCSDEEVDDEVVNRAYRICDGVDGAVRPTHGVITAVLQGSPDGGAMTFPPVIANPSSPPSSTSTSSISKSTHKTTTSERRSTTEPTTTTTPTSTTEPPSSASSTESPTSTEVPAGVNNNDKDAKPSLSSAKIAGIAAGAVSGLAALIGLFFLARYLIRRRKRPSSSRQYHDSWMFNPDRGKEIGYHTRSSSDDLPHKSFPTIRPVPPTIKPYKRDSYRSSAIGLAVSPSARASPELNRTKTPQPQTPSQAVPLARSRPVSKLLPDKPDLPPLPTNITQSTQPGRGLTPPPSGQYQTLQSTIPTALPPLPTQSSGPSPTIRAVSYEPPTLQVQAATPSTSHTPPPATNVARAVPALLPKIYIPKRGEAPKSFTSPPPAIHPRQSVVTEFEEDTQPSSSSSGALRAISPAGQTWFPPSAGPLSPTSVAYVADGNGNWRLRPSRESNQTQKHAPSTQKQDELHVATAELAASNQTITKPLTSPPPAPSTKSPDLSSVRLSRATMPSPLFRQGHPSPRSISQPTTSSGLYPAPLQPRSASASATNTRQSQHSQRSQQSQKLSPVAESPQVRQYPNSGPTHRLYNPAIPHSTGHSATQDNDDDRSMLPSHARHRPVQPPSSAIRHNYPFHPSLRSGPGPNPLGIPHPAHRPYYPIYPPQQVQMQQSQQQQYQRQSYQNQIRNYPYKPAPAPAPVQHQMYQQPSQQCQYTPHSYQSQQPTDYLGSPQSMQNKRLGPNAPTMKIDSPSLSGDPRWRRQVDGGMRSSATPSTAIPWMDQ